MTQEKRKELEIQLLQLAGEIAIMDICPRRRGYEGDRKDKVNKFAEIKDILDKDICTD